MCTHIPLHTRADALLNPALVSAQLHPQLPLPGAMGPAPAPTPSDHHSPPLEDVPLVMSSVSDKPQGTVECLVQECPSFLQKGMLELFPGAKLKSEKLCVITLSKRRRMIWHRGPWPSKRKGRNCWNKWVTCMCVYTMSYVLQCLAKCMCVCTSDLCGVCLGCVYVCSTAVCNWAIVEFISTLLL